MISEEEEKARVKLIWERAETMRAVDSILFGLHDIVPELNSYKTINESAIEFIAYVSNANANTTSFLRSILFDYFDLSKISVNRIANNRFRIRLAFNK